MPSECHRLYDSLGDGNEIGGLAFLAAVSLVMGAQASAADLPMKAAPMSATVLMPTPLYNWPGFHVGGNVGYGWGTQDPLASFSGRYGWLIGGAVGGQI